MLYRQPILMTCPGKNQQRRWQREYVKKDEEKNQKEPNFTIAFHQRQTASVNLATEIAFAHAQTGRRFPRGSSARRPNKFFLDGNYWRAFYLEQCGGIPSNFAFFSVNN